MFFTQMVVIRDIWTGSLSVVIRKSTWQNVSVLQGHVTKIWFCVKIHVNIGGPTHLLVQLLVSLKIMLQIYKYKVTF